MRGVRFLVVLRCPCVFFLFDAGAAHGAHVHAQGDVLVDNDGPGITGGFRVPPYIQYYALGHTSDVTPLSSYLLPPTSYLLYPRLAALLGTYGKP